MIYDIWMIWFWYYKMIYDMIWFMNQPWIMIIYQWYDRARRPGTSWHDDLKMMNFKSVLWTLARSCAGMWAASWSRFSRRSLGQRKCGDWLGSWRVKDGGRASSFSFMALCGVKRGVFSSGCQAMLHSTWNLELNPIEMGWLRISISTEWLETRFRSMWSGP